MSQRPIPFVARQAVEHKSDGTRSGPAPLEQWRDAPAYVLLAEPGAGKTTAFRHEAIACGGTYVSAERFIALGESPATPGTPWFIDGLDHVRAGSAGHGDPMWAIVKRLHGAGRPRFRLACREADWFGMVDKDKLVAVAPGGKIAELHLYPLSDAAIAELLVGHGRSAGDAERFLEEAKRRNIRPLLGNPLLLGFMHHAVQGDQWPSGRAELYEMASQHLAREHNEERRTKPGELRPIPERIEDAGLLCALLLLTGHEGFPQPLSGLDSEGVLALDRLPPNLGVRDAQTAIASKFFASDETIRRPLHRTIAEYLGAKALARRVRDGLPIDRVLALMTAFDGGVVEPLRGLHAWLAVHCTCESDRRSLIRRDPLGVVLYGDPTAFTLAEQEIVLDALRAEAERYPWFRRGHWDSDPFGALATSAMVPRFRGLLSAPVRDNAHQALLDCVAAAIEHTSVPGCLTDLRDPLLAVVRDDTYFARVRAAALRAWLRLSAHDAASARSLLAQLHAAEIDDPDDELTGTLLDALYPDTVGPRELLAFYRPAKRDGFIGTYYYFWSRSFLDRTPGLALAVLADHWPAAHSERAGWKWDYYHRQRTGRLLVATVEAHGDRTSIAQLYGWLGKGLDEYGHRALDQEHVAALAAWLAERPEIQKRLVAHGWGQVRPDERSGRRFLWEAECRLFGATRPVDWYRWMLSQAATSDDEELVRYCFDQAAGVAITALPGFDIPMECVEQWVEDQRAKWPTASEWLSQAWSSRLDDWQGEQHRRVAERKAERARQRDERRRQIAPYLGALPCGAAPPVLLMDIAYAYHGLFTDIEGDSPVARVQDLLGGSIEQADSAIKGLERVLDRGDLPSVEDILQLDASQRHHPLRPAALLGARLLHDREPAAWLRWTDDLAQRMVAFWLTDGTGDTPGWYAELCLHRPDRVAAVLVPYARQRIRRHPDSSVIGLWQLTEDDRYAALARLALPGLLDGFPVRAKENQLRILNAQLLRAASRHLDPVELTAIIERRLEAKSLDVGQRISWLSAGLAIDPVRYTRALVSCVGSSEVRAAHLGRALAQQGIKRRSTDRPSADSLGRLVELIALFASPEYPKGASFRGEADQIRELVLGFVSQLAAFESDDAGKELERLESLPVLDAWKHVIQGARFDQRRVARNASFRHPSPEQVASTLASKKPANALDLMAYVLDLLGRTQFKLRGDDSNGLELFRCGKEGPAKTENECRDVLLPMLRDAASRHDVLIEKEGSSSRDGRVDMRATLMHEGRRIAVPIEVKKTTHDQLWSAPRDQLRDLYAVDPDACGAGIYLVLWFGERIVRSPEGYRPATPGELRQALTDSLDPADRQRLRVFVMDLSLPVKHHSPPSTRQGVRGRAVADQLR
jgi:hypothetical protein